MTAGLWRQLAACCWVAALTAPGALAQAVGLNITFPQADVSLCSLEDYSYEFLVSLDAQAKALVSAGPVSLQLEFPKEFSYLPSLTNGSVRVNGAVLSFSLGPQLYPVFRLAGVRLGQAAAGDKITIFQSKSIVSPFASGEFLYSLKLVLSSTQTLVASFKRTGSSNRLAVQGSFEAPTTNSLSCLSLIVNHSCSFVPPDAYLRISGPKGSNYFAQAVSAAVDGLGQLSVSREGSDLIIPSIGAVPFRGKQIKICSVSTFRYVSTQCIFNVSLQDRLYSSEQGYANGLLCLETRQPNQLKKLEFGLADSEEKYVARKPNTIKIVAEFGIDVMTTDTIRVSLSPEMVDNNYKLSAQDIRLFTGSSEVPCQATVALSKSDGRTEVDLKYFATQMSRPIEVWLSKFNGTQGTGDLAQPVVMSLIGNDGSGSLRSSIGQVTFSAFSFDASFSVNEMRRGELAVLLLYLNIPPHLTANAFVVVDFPAAVPLPDLTLNLQQSEGVAELLVATREGNSFKIASQDWSRLFTLPAITLRFSFRHPTELLELGAIQILLKGKDDSVLATSATKKIAVYEPVTLQLVKAAINKIPGSTVSFEVQLELQASQFLPRRFAMFVLTQDYPLMFKDSSELKGCLQLNSVQVSALTCRRSKIEAGWALELDSMLASLEDHTALTKQLRLSIHDVDFDSQVLSTNIKLAIVVASSSLSVNNATLSYQLTNYCSEGCATCFKKDENHCTSCLSGYSFDEKICFKMQKYYKAYLIVRVVTGVGLGLLLLVGSAVYHKRHKDNLIFTVLKISTSLVSSLMLWCAVPLSILAESQLMLGWTLVSLLSVFTANLLVLMHLCKKQSVTAWWVKLTLVLLHFSILFKYIKECKVIRSTFMIDNIYKNRKKGERRSLMNQNVLPGQNLTIKFGFYCALRAWNICFKLTQIVGLFVLIGLSALKKTKQRIFYEYFFFLAVEIAAYVFNLDYIPNSQGEENRLAHEASTLNLILNQSDNPQQKKQAEPSVEPPRLEAQPQAAACDPKTVDYESIVVHSQKFDAASYPQPSSTEHPQADEEDSLCLNGERMEAISSLRAEDPIESLIRSLTSASSFSNLIKA